MARPTDERAWTSLDDVDYEDDVDGANPIPDDDGNVVLRRNASSKEATSGKDKQLQRGKRRR